jgi:hypothetical protein
LLYYRKEDITTTLSEIAQFCCETTGDTSSPMLDYAKRAVRLKYATLYDAHAWRESMRTLEAQPIDPSLGGIIFLPFDAEEVIFLSLSRDAVNYSRLIYRERDWIERNRAPLWSLPGYLPWFYRAENLAWPYLNPGKFTFTTSELSPFNVYIEGNDTNGHAVSETFIVNAAQQPNGNIIPMSVQTANAYSKVFSLSKTSGSVTIQTEQPVTGAQTIVLPAANSELVFSQFVLYPQLIWTDQNGAPIPYVYRTQVKLKPDTLDNDQSVPRISHIWDALIEFTLSALYTRLRQLSKADSREQKAIAHVQAAVNVEKNQSESRQQVVPTIYETGDYLGPAGLPVTSATPFG